MTAQNHAITGALIGLTVSNPPLAAVLAVASHFVCDAIPHYDPSGDDTSSRIRSKRFIVEHLLLGAGLCFVLVIVLGISKPHHWMLAAVCAFLATSPDFFWIPRFIVTRRTGTDPGPTNWFLRFHSAIQWKTGPQFFGVELLWFITGCLVLSRFL